MVSTSKDKFIYKCLHNSFFIEVTWRDWISSVLATRYQGANPTSKLLNIPNSIIKPLTALIEYRRLQCDSLKFQKIFKRF